ncbi:PH domain-containing protein [Protaetiibacter mangrovi]|uniref:PH domain-containing protein n=1 Tax=Protaetiibacter mangrovi TaxID=2970926 RepID=A0ABT1ZFS5_9MICO|nr:PH domain-containing protein [Protaetiibacter mangrovi]MCS0499495.1 PH domain-containing protein [Protaetiibacter mangrovi]TPX05582.1 PH domain-containing protein [Schumannella luteola]
MTQATPTAASGSARTVQPETVVARLRSHGRVLFWPCVVLVADAAALGYFGGTFPEAWQNWAVLGGALLVAVVLFLIPLISWLGRNYTITTRRIVLRHGVFVRTRQELLHSRGYDVTVRKAGLQPLFGSGNVLVNTGLERPVVLRDVPGADLVQATLHDLMELSVNPVASRRQQEQSRPPDETTAYGRR